MPPYSVLFGGWPWPLLQASKFLAWACAFLWIIPVIHPITRTLSFSVLMVQFYLCVFPEYAFPWYFPPVAVLSFCVFALVLDQALGGAAARPRAHRIARLALAVAPTGLKAVAGTVVAGVLLITVMAAVQLKLFQSIIYARNYKQVGLWLHDHASSPHDTVFLEPLGYIGFYSNLKMCDYPGLSSNEMIEARKHFPTQGLEARSIFADLIPFMKPDWVVLRPVEIDLINKKNPKLLTSDYRPVKTFDVSKEVQAVTHLPGRPWFLLDQTFIVFHRSQ
jgi:hypothetical protein